MEEKGGYGKLTPARINAGRVGTRPTTSVWLSFRADHAHARDAVHSELSNSFLETMRQRESLILQSSCHSRADFILNPPCGKRVDEEILENLCREAVKQADVQIVISDGLSAAAVEANIPDLLPILEDGLRQENFKLGTVVVVRFGRVAVGDQIAHRLGARLVINLIGERPGLSSTNSLSAYITLNPGPQTISSDRTVVSNIHESGTPPLEAGAYIVELVKKIFKLNLSGVRFQQASS